MKIVYAPDSYGGFLSAPEACERVEAQLASRDIFIEPHPLSDGGEGLLQTLMAHSTLELHGQTVPGPDREPIFASAARWNGTWWVEVAEVIGLQHCGDFRQPMKATSVGLGHLLSGVCDRAPGPTIVGLGGSATVDGGVGLAQGLGLRVLDADNQPLPRHASAKDLHRIARVEGPLPLPDRLFRVLCDVRTPLVDAIEQFGPHKGVEPHEVAPLTDALVGWASVLNDWRSRHGRAPIDPDIRGGGAAGGLGFALAAIVGAHLVEGAPTVAHLTGLQDSVRGAQVLVLGEGRLDATSYQGKVAEVVTRMARDVGAKVVALVGQAQSFPQPPEGPDTIIEIAGQSTQALNHAVGRLADWIKAQGRRS